MEKLVTSYKRTFELGHSVHLLDAKMYTDI